MSRKGYLTVLVAVLVAALFVVPGMALGKKGGNGTPNPPPTNPPCDSDGHAKDPAFLAKHKQCNGGGTTGNGTGNSNGNSTGNSCKEKENGKGKEKDCNDDKDTDTGGTTTSSSTTSTSTTSSTTSSSTTTATTGGTEEPCETDGILGSKGLSLSTSNETLADHVSDMGVLGLQDPEVPGSGALSTGVYNLVQPVGGDVVAAEVACPINLLGL